MRRIIVVALAAIALMAVVVSLATRSDDATPTTPATVEIPRDEVTRADTRVVRPTVAPAGTIQGTVVLGDDRTPDDGRLVELVQGDAVVARATTDGIGEFAFRAVAPGESHEVRVAAEDCLTVRVRSITLLPNEHRDVGTLVLAPPCIVPVTVTDERGRPVPGTVVDVYREGRRAPPIPEPVASVLIDERGEGELQLGVGRLHTVVAHAPGYARVDAPLVEMLLMDGDGRLRLVLPPAQTLTGTVVGLTGAPVPEALVYARRRPRVWDTHHGERADSAALWHTVRTDADGVFQLTSLPPGTIDLCCGRDDALPGSLSSVEVPEISDVRLVLRETASLGGRATDRDTDDPLAGVVVEYNVGEFGGTVVTDADGLYHVDGLTAGELVHVWLSPPAGWSGPIQRGVERVPSGVAGGTFQEWLHADEHLVLDLSYRRAAVVEGTVTMDGKPAAAARVRVYTLADPPLPGANRTTRSNADGHYRIDDAVPGRAVALAVPSSVSSNDEYSAFSDLWEERFESEESLDAAAVAISATATTRLDVVAALPEDFEPWSDRSARMDEAFLSAGRMRRIRVSGRVTTADGLSLREVKVAAADGEADDPVDVRDDFESWNLLVVSADGRFEGTADVYPNAPEDSEDPDAAAASVTFVLHVSAVDARHGAVAQDVTIRADDADEGVTVDLVLPPLPVLRGTVVSDGEPVPDAGVYAGRSLIARTDADGAFEIRLATGTHHLEARADGFVDSNSYGVSVPEDEEVEIELAAARTLSGRVSDSAGQPVPGVLVHPHDEDGDRLRGYGGNWEGGRVPLTDAEGRFRFDRLPRAPVYLELASSERGSVVTARFSAGPFGPDDRDVQIVTVPPRRLTGRVVIPDGAEAGRLSIHCTALEDALAAGGGDRKTWTGTSGTFTFDDLLFAPYELSVVPRPSSKLQPVEIEIARDQEEVDIVLELAAVISGVARWKDGSPFAPDLQLRPLDDIAEGVSTWDLRIDIEDDGSFEAFVQSGTRYSIELRRDDWGDAIRIEGGEMVLAGTTGLEITATHNVDGIDPEARSAGSMGGTIVTTGGAAVAGADVLVFPSAGSAERTTTDAEGRFSVTGLDAAATTASVAVFADGRCSTQIDDVKIGKTDVRIALSSARTISGLLLTADGAPATGYRIRAWRTANPIHDLWRADVDADGAFVLTGVARGTWTLEAIVERRDGIHEVVTLGIAKGGAKDLELRLP